LCWETTHSVNAAKASNRASPYAAPARCRRRCPACRANGRRRRSASAVSTYCLSAVAVSGEACRIISTGSENTRTCQRKSITDHYRRSGRFPSERALGADYGVSA
jgi:hypothetical protein